MNKPRVTPSPSPNNPPEALDRDGQGAPPTSDNAKSPPANGQAAMPTAPDPFDPASLRLGQDFAAGLSLKKILTTVPVRPPERTWFVRIHPSEEYSVPTVLLTLKDDREDYLILPELRAALSTEATCAPWQLFTAVNRQGTVFLWKVRLPGSDGKDNPWWDSARQAVALARTQWVRVTANMGAGGYDLLAASADLPEPTWPDQTFRDLLAIAFRGRVIDTLDHPVLRRLRGEQ